MADDEKYKLTCLIQGEKSIFPVLVPRTADVDELRDLIYKRGEKGVFRCIDSKDLTLFRVLPGYSCDHIARLTYPSRRLK
jgi:hypothetical protein